MMHARQLAEIGSWVAIHSGNLVYGQQEQPMLAASGYWTASKIRQERWVTALKMFEQDMARIAEAESTLSSQSHLAFGDCSADSTAEASLASADSISSHDPWPALEIVVQEILFSEMVTRIWSAAVLTHDWYHQTDELHGLAHSIHISHLEARNRAMRILLKGQVVNEQAFDRLNRLRRRMERWTDLFLGQLPHGAQASKFAFDPERVRDFHREQRESLGAGFSVRQKVLTASFSVDLLRDCVPYAANPELNREIASGILACFPSDRFDSLGLPKSAQMIWMEKSQNDTQQLVDHLMEFENAAENRAW